MLHTRQRHYIETSSVRKARGRLHDIVRIPDCFTSALVLFELLTPAKDSEREFCDRRECISVLLEIDRSTPLIEWMLPKDRAKAAFPYLHYKPEHIGRFYQLVQCANDSECRAEFAQRLESLQLSGYLERVKREHSDIADVANRIRRAPSLKQEADSFIEQHWSDAERSEKRQKRRQLLKAYKAYLNKTGHPGAVTAFARQWASECFSAPTEEAVRRTVDSYDRSTDIFIDGFDVALVNCTSGRVAGENDFADLLHLLYLREGDVLVSEEAPGRLVPSIAREIGIIVKPIEDLRT